MAFRHTHLIGSLAVAGVIGIVLAACGGGSATATPLPTSKPSPAGTGAPSATPQPLATSQAQPTATRPPVTPTPQPTATQAVTPTAAGLQPRYGGILQARFFRYPETFDTYQACCGYVHGIFQNVLNHLIRYKWDSISDIEGDLALGWDVGADGKTYTFRLRRDVRWQDGKPFTSADILFNFQRASDPKYTFHKARVAPIASMEAPDPYTFKTTLKKVSASYIPNISSAFFIMYPAHISDPAAWQSAPVGTGAHRVKQSTKDVSVELVRNPNYFRKDAAGRALPYLDGIVYTVIADRALSLAAFLSGRVQCACTFDKDFMNDAEDQIRREVPGVKLGRFGGGTLTLQFNVQKTPFDNPAFRQGVAIGLDKEQVAAVVYKDKAMYPHPPLLMPTEMGGQWGLPSAELARVPGFYVDQSRNLALAQQKFKESGIDPKTVSVSILTSTTTVPDADALASAMTVALGLRTRVENVASIVDVTQRKNQGNFQMNIEPRGITVDDPAEWFAGFLANGGAFNFGKYGNPRLDELLIAQDSELDPFKRKAMIWEMQRIVLTDLPIVPLSGQLGVRGTRPEVFGYSAGPLTHSNVRLDQVWLQP